MNKQRISKSRRKKKRAAKQLTRSLFGSKMQGGRKVTLPATIGYVNRSSSKPMREVNIRHTEFVDDVISSAGTSGFELLKSYPINPGMEVTFPWLSQISVMFERYKFNKLNFTYSPSIGTTENGKVLMAIDYDAADDNTAISKQELMAWEDSKNGPVWNKLQTQLRKRNFAQLKSHYVRRRPLVANLDIKTYDVGNLYLADSNTSASTPVGELYVSYDITLYNPQLNGNSEVESAIFKTLNPTDKYKPYSGTVGSNILNMAIEVASDQSLLLKEAGKYVIDVFGQAATNTGALNAVTVDKGLITENPETTAGPLYNGTLASRSYLIDTEGKDDVTVTWTGMPNAGSTPTLLSTEIVRVPIQFQY